MPLRITPMYTYFENLVCLNKFSTKFGGMMGFTFDIDLLVERFCSDDCLRFEVTVFAGGHCLDPREVLVPADFLRFKG